MNHRSAPCRNPLPDSTLNNTALASTIYCLIALALARLGLGGVRHASGFVSSVLFVVPGFPLVAAAVDLVQDDLSVGVTRLAYGMMLVLAGGFGICVVAGAAGLSAEAPPPWLINPMVASTLWEMATFVGACGFSILYSNWPTVFVVGLLALAGNNLRFALHDWGMSLSSATFLGAFTVGLLATVAKPVPQVPRIAVTVPGIIIMVPGTLTCEAIIHFEKGDIASAMANALPAGFVLGAMALGLAAARLRTVKQQHTVVGQHSIGRDTVRYKALAQEIALQYLSVAN
jgi:uncharacterized membrane protein YjjB (DUF3815 family)